MTFVAALLALAVPDGGALDLGAALEQTPHLRSIELGPCNGTGPSLLSAMLDDGSGVACLMLPACREWALPSQRERTETELCRSKKPSATSGPPDWIAAIFEAVRRSPERTISPLGGPTSATTEGALRITSPDALAVKHGGRWTVVPGLGDAISVIGDASALAGEPAVLVSEESSGGTAYMTGSTEVLVVALRSPTVVLGRVFTGAWFGQRSSTGISHERICEVTLVPMLVAGGRLRLVRGRVVQSKKNPCTGELKILENAGDYCFEEGALRRCPP
jgi:hypothetical protein